VGEYTEIERGKSMTEHRRKEETTRPGIGDAMPDGTVYAGISPDTGKALYATPADAPHICSFNQAQEYARRLVAHGHNDWRVPTKSELNLLFRNRRAIQGFDISGSHPAGRYWSSSHHLAYHVWAQRFSDGHQFYYVKINGSSLRCIRG
jgi:hypothetical protein